MQWAWGPDTPSAASPGCSSPLCPAALVHYLQKDMSVRFTAGSLPIQHYPKS